MELLASLKASLAGDDTCRPRKIVEQLQEAARDG